MWQIFLLLRPIRNSWHNFPCTFGPKWQIFLLLRPTWKTFGTEILALLILCDKFSCYSGLLEKLLAQKSLHFCSYVTDFLLLRPIRISWHNLPCTFGPMWQIFLLLRPTWKTFGTEILALFILCDRFSCYLGLFENHLAQKSLHFSSFVTDFPATRAYLNNIWHKNPCTIDPLWQIFLLLRPIWKTFGTEILALLVLCDRFSCYSGLFKKLLAQFSLHFWSHVTDFPAIYSGLLEKHLAQKSLHFLSFVTDFPAIYISNTSEGGFAPLQIVGTDFLALLIICDRFSCWVDSMRKFTWIVATFTHFGEGLCPLTNHNSSYYYPQFVPVYVGVALRATPNEIIHDEECLNQFFHGKV